ncbi:hypothetical protein NQ314_003331 [Rhamnusium bicolor]|uniref:Uncharacterized protein n=1 Tax=Rhamnusium bicolor TaxID=1586634 RepID=A0AAV8ZPY6_9CUCU|nr:hypothetical protein NQ314_003331 [Rhamnusium bicolor]
MHIFVSIPLLEFLKILRELDLVSIKFEDEQDEISELISIAFSAFLTGNDKEAPNSNCLVLIAVNFRECYYCEEIDNAEHTAFRCERWRDERLMTEGQLAGLMHSDNIIREMLESETKWYLVEGMLTRIMREKKRDGREQNDNEENLEQLGNSEGSETDEIEVQDYDTDSEVSVDEKIEDAESIERQVQGDSGDIEDDGEMEPIASGSRKQVPTYIGPLAEDLLAQEYQTTLVGLRERNSSAICSN